MIDNETKEYIKQQLAQAKKDSIYSTKNVSGSTHNGIDGSKVSYNSLTNLVLISGNGVPTTSAKQGTLYINLTASTTTTRLYINTNGGTTWAHFTASA